MSLEFKIKNAPQKPGVYIYKNKNKIIYVGKAKNIRKRVKSYFVKKHSDLKTASLVKKIDDVQFTVTANEVEALILENNLIKKHRPTYNIVFKDDKTYPYIAVTVGDDFPRIMITRERHKKETAYFGPYTNVSALKKTFEILRKIFPLRTCKQEKPGRRGSKPCLNYHIKRCLGPCNGKIYKDEYRQIVKQVLMFLEGKGDEVIGILEKQMKKESGKLNFEDAARFRNSIESARQVLAKQKVVFEDDEDIDILGVARLLGYLSVTVFSVKKGKLLSNDNFIHELGLEVEPLSSFIKQYYKQAGLIPKRICLPQKISETEALEEWIEGLLGKKVKINVPQRGRKFKLVKMASENADYSLSLYLKKMDVEAKNALFAKKQMEEITGIADIKRMECYDVSNISGSKAVASMVVFKDGMPQKDDYRKFKMKTVSGIDDCAMLYEALTRRMKYLVEMQDAGYKSQKKKNSKQSNNLTIKPSDSSFAQKPDLIIIDGGAGQLRAALKATASFKGNIKVISIAKKEEEIYLENSKKPIKLEEDNPALFLIQRIRDEAHRFAVTFHRQLRSKALKDSLLDGVEGIGAARKKALMKKFGSVEKLKKANVEQLQEVSGISRDLAKNIKGKINEGA